MMILDDDDSIMSSTLAKFTGLYHVVDPDCRKLFGRNAYHVISAIMIAYTVGCLSPLPIGLYVWSNDTTQFVLQLTAVSNFSFGCYKSFTMVRHSEDIRRCLEIARIDFVSVDRKSVEYLRTRRVASSKFTVWFSVVNYCILLLWTVSPFVLRGKYIEVKNRDGSYSDYHFNPYNMYFLVSNDTYNRYYLTFQLLEWLLGLCFVRAMVLFDTFMVTMCVSITGQLKVIGRAYKRLGYANFCFDGGNSELENSRKNIEHLKLIIKHHQKVIGKMNDFYRIVEPVILPQLMVASFTVISLSYVITMNYFDGMLLTSTQSLKIMAFPTFVCQIYYTCFVFGVVNNQKNAMNFSLYSCNWTQMEIKFRKLLLLAMNMNNSNKLNMKLTDKLCINLELFTSVIHLCYSVFSVLVNSRLKLSKKI